MTTTTIKALTSLQPGDVFRYRGGEYVLVKYGRGTKEHIAERTSGKRYTLSRTAQVEFVEHDVDALAKALAAEDAKAPTLRPGTKVRIKDTPAARKHGIVGAESVIIRKNAKTYSLANDWRVSPDMVEEV